MDNSPSCPFCSLPDARVLFRNGHAIAFRDRFPVTPGHTLVIPTRHLGSLFDSILEERNSLFELLDLAKMQIESKFAPAGYNIGINDGAAAGQTVGHLHIHPIPRYPGDLADPCGGVRWVIPEKADYGTEQK